MMIQTDQPELSVMNKVELEIVFDDATKDYISISELRQGEYVKQLSNLPNVVTIGKIESLVVEVLY
ncbi:hypothetical protein [Deefgea rivuli]|uniref:hypothetical protein n=1 Tax=Deefgea rivuli TaxID=400948 RepID=UPI0012EC54B6|nr:hypothetical protein [Deefgea rivuli]